MISDSCFNNIYIYIYIYIYKIFYTVSAYIYHKSVDNMNDVCKEWGIIFMLRCYGIIFWGSSSYANKVFILQKQIIRIIMSTRARDSCREVFKNMEIMTLYSQYMYSLF
jgi:hypothetical protein